MKSNAGSIIENPILTTGYSISESGRKGVYTLNDLGYLMDRSRDPERVTLEALAALHDANDSGVIKVASELLFCDRCVDAFDDFDAIFGKKIIIDRISSNVKSRPKWRSRI